MSCLFPFRKSSVRAVAAMLFLLNVKADEIDGTASDSNLEGTTKEDLICYLNDKSQCNVIDIIRQVVASLSLVGCVFIIFTQLLFGMYVHFRNRLVLNLTLVGVMHSICFLSNDLQPHGPACVALGSILHFTELGTLLWICCIAFNIYMNTVQMKQTVQYEKIYHIVSWGIPLITTISLLSVDAYGQAGTWCWIVDKDGLRFGLWYGPLIFVIFTLFIIYPYIIWTVYKLGKSAKLGNLDEIKNRRMTYKESDVKPLIAYPIVYLLVVIFSLINRIQNAVSGDPIFGIVVLHALFSPSQSAMNAIVYALSNVIFSKLRPTQIKSTISKVFQKDPHLINNKDVNHDIQMSVFP